jgi:hypothetical protein
MPDYITNPQIEPAWGGPKNFASELYKMISGVPEGYFQGRKEQFEQGQRKRTEELQKPFLDAQGNPVTDFGELTKEMLRRGGPDAAKELMPYLWKEKFLQEDTGQGPSAYGGAARAPDTSGTVSQSPNVLRAASGVPARQPAGQPELSSAGTDDKGLDTVRGLATERGMDVDTPGFKEAFRGLPDGIDTEIPPDRVDGVVKQFANLKRAGMFGPVDEATGGTARPATAPAAPPTQGPPGVGPGSLYAQAIPQQPATAQPPAAAPGGAAGMVPPGVDPRLYAQRLKQAAEFERTQARREGIAGIPSKAREDKAAAYDKTADDVLKEIGEAGRPTGAQKEARDPAVVAAAAQKKLAEDVSAAKGKRIGEVIEAGGKSSRDTINVLDEMKGALESAGNDITTGPAAREILRVKQAVNNVLPGTFKHVAEAETIDKLNAQLAAAAAKAMTARPSQLEFKAFMANNPGLLTSKQGSFILMDMLRQAKMQDIGLGQLAMNAKGFDNWTDVENKFYRDNPIISPFTNKPLGAKQAPDGKWYMPDPDRRGKYLEVR